MEKTTLVIYYSRTGTTKQLAQSIISLTDADSEELIDTKKRSGLLGYLKAGHAAARKWSTTIQLPKIDPSRYEKVYIGSPVRDFGMSCAMRTYLGKYGPKLPAQVHFFCTMEREGSRELFHEMTIISGRKPTSVIAYTKKEIRQGDYLDRLQKFLFPQENVEIA